MRAPSFPVISISSIMFDESKYQTPSEDKYQKEKEKEDLKIFDKKKLGINDDEKKKILKKNMNIFIM